MGEEQSIEAARHADRDKEQEESEADDHARQDDGHHEEKIEEALADEPVDPDESERREDAEKIKRYIRDQELVGDPRAFAARVRAEMHHLVRALAHHDWEEAVFSIRQIEGAEPWTEDRLQIEMAPFFSLHGELDFSALEPQAK